MSLMLRKEGPFALVSIVGLITILEYYTVEPTIDLASKTIGNWTVLIMAFTLLLAAVRGFLYNINLVRRRGSKWHFSVVFLAAGIAILALGIWDTSKGPYYIWWYTWGFTMIGTAGVNAVNGLWIMSGIFRTFRAKSLLASSCILGLIIGIYGQQLAIGTFIPYMPELGIWSFDVPMTAGFRALEIGVGIGGIFLGIRTLLARERRIFGAE